MRHRKVFECGSRANQKGISEIDHQKGKRHFSRPRSAVRCPLTTINNNTEDIPYLVHTFYGSYTIPSTSLSPNTSFTHTSGSGSTIQKVAAQKERQIAGQASIVPAAQRLHLGSPVGFFEKITTTNCKIITSSQMSDNSARMGNERRRLAVEEGFWIAF